MYTLEYTSDCGTVNDTAFIFHDLLAAPDLGNDTVILGGTFLLDPQLNNPQVTYLWSDGSTSSTLTVSEAGTYWVEISEGSCVAVDTISISFATGISVKSSTAFSVYPNPFNGQTNLRFQHPGSSIYSVEVMDVSGKSVIRLSGSCSEAATEVSVDLTDKSAGIYFLMIKTDDQLLQAIKLVKQ